MNALQAKVGTASDDQILEMLTMLGGGILSNEKAMVRAELYEEYERREGGEKLDILFVAMGM